MKQYTTEQIMKAIENKFYSEVNHVLINGKHYPKETILDWHKEHIIMFGGKLRKKNENEELKWEAEQHNKVVEELFPNNKELKIKMVKNLKNKYTFK